MSPGSTGGTHAAASSARASTRSGAAATREGRAAWLCRTAAWAAAEAAAEATQGGREFGECSERVQEVPCAWLKDCMRRPIEGPLTERRLQGRVGCPLT